MVATLACGESASPPGRTVFSEPPVASLAAPASATAPAPEPAEPHREQPSSAHKIASIAMRTWIYQEPDGGATKLGYLRAGGVVNRAERAAGSRDCDGGWYRIEPRGYVCVGKGASLDPQHPVVQAALRGPLRGAPHPYRYVMSRRRTPYLYFMLPPKAEQERVEGQQRARAMALFEAKNYDLGPADPIPEYLRSGKRLPKPYGADKALELRSHRGRATEDSAFGLIAQFDWTGRRMGLTTELDLIPLDYMRPADESTMQGLKIEEPGQPAFVYQHSVHTYQRNALNRLVKRGRAAFRSAWMIPPEAKQENGLLPTTAGVWLPKSALRIARKRQDPAGFARDGRKWIDVSIRQQLLVAYEGKRPVFATLVSTGRGELGDPEETTATVRGTFMIHAKHVSGTMDGDDTTEDSFDLRDVPYIQYFHKGYALHGAYWHDAFGKVRSHGCINLAPVDAAWLFEWTDPDVPAQWHSARNVNHGTLVYIHR